MAAEKSRFTESYVRSLAQESPAPLRLARRKNSVLVIANRHEIASAGIAALVQRGGHRVVAHCSCEHDLLHSAEAYRPDVIVLAQNIVRQEPAKTVLQLRARNCSVSIIFLLDERDAITAAGLMDLDVEGILSNAACARTVIDCVESVCHGCKWVGSDLLRPLAMAERCSQNGNCLTSREAEIAHFVSRGLRNKQIARELHVLEGTVKMHLHHIYEKLHLSGRTQLALSMAEISAQMPTSSNAPPAGKPIDSVAASRLVAGHN
jgi:DNA-binding NarL/FixJ family response regulator